MKKLVDLLEKVEPSKDNKFLHTLFDGLHTFLFQPKYTTETGTHIKDGMDLKRTMVHVVLAMQLCFVTGFINIGHQFFLSQGLFPGLLDGLIPKVAYGLIQMLPIIIVVHVVGLGIEFFFAARKGHPIEEGFLVSGFLIPLIMPPNVPLWMVALATAFAVIIAKEAFGGTGMNVLNIALTARVFVFFAYPGEISGDLVWVSGLGGIADSNIVNQWVFTDMIANWQAEAMAAATAAGYSGIIDGYSGATPLALGAAGGWNAIQAASYDIFNPATGLMETTQQYSVMNMVMGFIPGSIGEMNKPAVILGALILIGAGIGSWRIMLSMLLGAAFMGVMLNIIASSTFAGNEMNVFVGVPWYYQLIMGSFLFAMAFMATDPVTAASTNTGKLVYGFMIGVLGMIIRVLNPAYPEGWMLAILFMNVFAPLIDHLVIQSNVNRRLNRVKAV